MAATALAQDASKDVTIVLKNAMAAIDSCDTTDTSGIVTRENIIEALTRVDYASGDSTNILPGLATSWEQLDPLTWRLQLREGVKFHNGEDFNADAVVAAVDRMFNPEIDCRNRSYFGADAKFTATAVEPYVVDIVTEAPKPLMPLLMSWLGVAAPSMRKEPLSANPVGTGPYSVVQRNADEDVRLTRFDGYWGDLPEIENVTFTSRSEATLRAAMIEVGEADVAMFLAPREATQENDVCYLSGSTSRVRFTFSAPLDDIRIRQAMNLAADREGIRLGILGEAYQSASQIVLPNIIGYNPDLTVPEYNPDEARRLIEEARADGVPVDSEIKLIHLTGSYPGAKEVMEALTAMWNEVGLNVTMQTTERLEWLEISNKPFAEPRAAMLIQESHGNTNGDASFSLPLRFYSSGRQTEFNSPEIDAAIDAGLQASGQERQDFFAEAFRVAEQDVVPGVLLFHMVDCTRVGPRVQADAHYYNNWFEISVLKLN